MKKIIYIFLMLILTLTINSRVFAATISTESIEGNSSLVEVASVDNSKWRVVDYTNYTLD